MIDLHHTFMPVFYFPHFSCQSVPRRKYGDYESQQSDSYAGSPSDSQLGKQPRRSAGTAPGKGRKMPGKGRGVSGSNGDESDDEGDEDDDFDGEDYEGGGDDGEDDEDDEDQESHPPYGQGRGKGKGKGKGGIRPGRGKGKGKGYSPAPVFAEEDEDEEDQEDDDEYDEEEEEQEYQRLAQKSRSRETNGGDEEEEEYEQEEDEDDEDSSQSRPFGTKHPQYGSLEDDDDDDDDDENGQSQLYSTQPASLLTTSQPQSSNDLFSGGDFASFTSDFQPQDPDDLSYFQQTTTSVDDNPASGIPITDFSEFDFETSLGAAAASGVPLTGGTGSLADLTSDSLLDLDAELEELEGGPVRKKQRV